MCVFVTCVNGQPGYTCTENVLFRYMLGGGQELEHVPKMFFFVTYLDVGERFP